MRKHKVNNAVRGDAVRDEQEAPLKPDMDLYGASDKLRDGLSKRTRTDERVDKLVNGQLKNLWVVV